jgi:hypothetical protein
MEIEVKRKFLVDGDKKLYITIIKEENIGWEIGYNLSDNLKEHIEFKNEIITSSNIDDVKILEVKEIDN